MMSCHKRTKQEELQQWEYRLRKYEANHKSNIIISSSKLKVYSDSAHLQNDSRH
jgi:hypothetical protein